MLELITSLKAIKDQVGIDGLGDFLHPHLALDGLKSVTPLLLKAGEKRYLMVKGIEKGSVSQLTIDDAEVLFYRPYFTFDDIEHNRQIHAEWYDLIRDKFSGERHIKAHNDMIVSCLWEMEKYFNVTVAEAETDQPVYCYQVDKAEVLKSFTEDNQIYRAKAEELALNLADGEKIIARMKKGDGDSRFALLDEMLGQQGIKKLLLTSPINVQEVTALGMFDEVRTEVVVAYLKDTQVIYVFSFQRIPEWTEKIIPLTYANLREAMESVQVSGKWGIEEASCPITVFNQAGLERENTLNCSNMLRLWREKRAGEDLACYVIAAQAARHAIEKALQFAEKQVRSGADVSEKDVDRQRINSLAEFINMHRLPAQIRDYYVVLHAGNRTMIPSMPANHKLAGAKTLKLDFGILFFDTRGRLRACSDLCRTSTFNEAAGEVYDLMTRLMVEQVIPSCLPGKRAEEVYFTGLRVLEPYVPRLKQIGLMPQACSLQDYQRDIGHTLGKQEPAAVLFKEGNDIVLEDGMIGCVEYQWPCAGNAIGTEDMFLMTGNGVINLTR